MKKLSRPPLIVITIFLVYKEKIYPALIILLLILIAELSQTVDRLLEKIFERLIIFIGKINNFIVLSIFYYLIFTPYAFFYRWFRGKNQLPSSYVDNHIELKAEDFEKQW